MGPDEELCEVVPLLGDPRAEDVGAEDLHQDVELQGVGEEDGETEHAERHLSQGRLAGQVESDGRLG